MDVLKRIVVGVAMPESRPWMVANLDPATRIAVRQAFRLAGSLRIPLHLVCAPEKPEPGLFGSEDAAEKQAAEDLEQARQMLTAVVEEYSKYAAEVTTQVTFGRAWFEILKAADVARDTLIICGTKHQGVVNRLLFGTTGLKLLRNAPGPVWLVKPRIDDDAVLDVLAATDLSEVGENVISAGVTLGRALPVQLTVMHVVDADHDRRAVHAGASEEDIARWRRQAMGEAEEGLQEQMSGTDVRTLSSGVQTQLAEGVPDACLLTAIEELDIDLLVMASSGRGGIPGMLFGNTAERLLPELPCSLLAIKPDDFQCPVEVA